MPYRHPLSLLVGLCLAGCGPSTVDSTSPALVLTLPESGLTTAAPALVSLSFSVDTASGKPVSGLSADAFELEEDGAPVSAFESQKTVVQRGRSFSMASVLLLDISGSILRSGSFPALEQAAKLYAHRVLAHPGQKLALYTFDGRASPTLRAPFTSDVGAIDAALSALESRECSVQADCAGFADRRTCAGWLCVDDSTNLNGAVMSALDTLDAEEANAATPFHDAALMVFTDGSDEAARVATDAAVERVRQSAAHVFAVGLGGDVDESVLRRLGKDGYQPAARADQLTEAFDAVAARVSALANRFYELDYCSPKRSGIHRLRLTATLKADDGSVTQGSVTRTFDATGFASGCQVTP